jgi:hypothetical protein
MKIIPFGNLEDEIGAYIFTILRSLKDKPAKFTVSREIQTSLNTAWIMNPRSPQGSRKFGKALNRAKKADLIFTEKGAGGGYCITEKGEALFYAEWDAHKYVNAIVLRREYRARIWPRPPAGPSLPLAA